MSELKKCPICHEQAKIGYACGDYFAHCSDGCPSPMCDHASESTTVCAWNDWAEWCEKYRRAQPENEPIVHCAECEHYAPSPMGGNGCLIRFNGRTEIIPRNPTDYCSYGKRSLKGARENDQRRQN